MGATSFLTRWSRVRGPFPIGMALVLSGWVPLSDAQARPTETFEFASTDAQSTWFRLRNQELEIDFSSARHHLPGSIRYRPLNLPLIGEGGLSLIDRLNGQSVEIASATTEVHSERDGSGLIVQRYRFPSPDGDWFRLDKRIRLLPDGAQLVVDYRVTNAGPLPRATRYSVVLPWGGGLSPCRYHLPLQDGIRRLDADFSADDMAVAPAELRDPWLCVESIRKPVSVFVVADNPFQGMTLAAPQGGARTLELVLWEGILGPSESAEGTFFIALFQDVGLPITATPRLVASASWAPSISGRGFQLESRLFGMPKEARRFRVFSQVYEQGRKVSLAPTYHQRSKLSPTSPLRVPLASLSSWPMIDLEQSVYSGSECIGYWKATLARPDWSGANGGLSLSVPPTAQAMSVPTMPSLADLPMEVEPAIGEAAPPSPPVPPTPLVAPPAPAQSTVEKQPPRLHEEKPAEEPPSAPPVEEDLWDLDQDPLRNADPWKPDESKPSETTISLPEIESPPLVVVSP